MMNAPSRRHQPWLPEASFIEASSSERGAVLMLWAESSAPEASLAASSLSPLESAERVVPFQPASPSSISLSYSPDG